MWPFARKEKSLAIVPATHARVVTWVDKCNEKLAKLETERTRVIDEIASRREELRQIDQVLAAYRAGLTVMVDDPTIEFTAAKEARQHIEGKMFADIDAEFGTLTVDEVLR
jgi:predicted  nucleic acid-binding Zn-ribbon protein